MFLRSARGDTIGIRKMTRIIKIEKMIKKAGKRKRIGIRKTTRMKKKAGNITRIGLERWQG